MPASTSASSARSVSAIGVVGIRPCAGRRGRRSRCAVVRAIRESPRARLSAGPSPVSAPHPNFVAIDGLLPAALEARSEEALAVAAAIELGGIEEGHTDVQSGVDDRARRVEVDPAAEVVAPEADARDAKLAPAELDVVHAADASRRGPISSGSHAWGRRRAARGRKLCLRATGDAAHARTPAGHPVDHDTGEAWSRCRQVMTPSRPLRLRRLLPCSYETPLTRGPDLRASAHMREPAWRQGSLAFDTTG